MSSVEIVLREIDRLSLSELWIVWERIQLRVKNSLLPPKPASTSRWNDFGFDRAQEVLKNYKGSFSDTLIEERRSQ